MCSARPYNFALRVGHKSRLLESPRNIDPCLGIHPLVSEQVKALRSFRQVTNVICYRQVGQMIYVGGQVMDFPSVWPVSYQWAFGGSHEKQQIQSKATGQVKKMAWHPCHCLVVLCLVQLGCPCSWARDNLRGNFRP